MASSSEKSRLVMGFVADGTHDLDYYRPSALEFVADIYKAEFADASAQKAQWGVSTPIPPGASLGGIQ